MAGRLGHGHTEGGDPGLRHRAILTGKRIIVIVLCLHFSVKAFWELEDRLS
jgi:hypothetical protein